MPLSGRSSRSAHRADVPEDRVFGPFASVSMNRTLGSGPTPAVAARPSCGAHNNGRRCRASQGVDSRERCKVSVERMALLFLPGGPTFWKDEELLAAPRRFSHDRKI